MRLDDSPLEAAFRAELRAWLEREVRAHGAPPPAGDWTARREYDTSWQRKLFDAGYAGMNWPAEYGGRGASLGEQLVYFEETARANAPYIGANFIGLMHGGPTLMAEGSEAQKAFHLPGILEGRHVWCQGFSEPTAGSDLASLRTVAVREGDQYVVTGHKIWSTRAHIADYCELLVRTDADAPAHKGITWLVLDMHQPGVDVRPLDTIEGDSHFCEVFLDGARVPVANRVGAENDGWRVANVTLRFERGTAFAQHIITMRTQLEGLVALARRAGPSGGASAWDGDASLRRTAGRLAAQIEALWRLTQLCVSEAEATGVPSLTGSAVKLRYSELYQEIGELGMHVVGRAALAREDVAGLPTGDVLHDYLWALQFTVSGGTSQIQRNIIGERILGLPREPR
ncbi:MAG: acyl-CoA dehydrogenase family protein [Myxococcales bacterium]|nr:acyl-CoA dehydrogenase family protein [Myxococcales bacterium]